ncbi:MAG: hydantoinase/oxoprolinase family protein [Gammaproteobacteria bacterium]|nr:hydantoinase/oxoprolinase family protein [Gammaproteobacteria bacterium]
MTVEIGIDTGGTFTDIVCRRSSGSSTHEVVFKVPSTPSDPSRAIAQGLNELITQHGVSPADISRFVHGTTVATNAVLERKGARVGIITTEGFRDALEIGRQMRTAIYELELTAQTPVFLAPRARRVEVSERVSAQGEVIVPMADTDLLAAAATLVDQDVEAIVVCFLFSFLNPTHEQRARALLDEAFPQLAISISSEVDPAFREYERVVATAFDAYTKPVLTTYLGRINGELTQAGVNAPLQVMQSRGGVSTAAVATQRPVRLFLSGPAAGVIGAADVAKEANVDDLITVDIGGTSCDIALVRDGAPTIRSEGVIDGFPVRVPMVDVNAIGSGGGSVAWLDGAGGLRVGPQSAGADPGPACYGRGGAHATVTDASLVLGLLNPAYFAGGTVNLDIALAQEVIDTTIARPLGMSVEAAALGIHQVLNAQMAEGMRLVSIRQGYDPRDFALVPLGGAGPLHACALAEELGISTIVVPRSPGVLSASGLLVAPIEHEVSVGFPHHIDKIELGDLREGLAQLDERCARLMAMEATGGQQVEVRYSADVCYVGQSHYLEVALRLDDDNPLQGLYRRFLKQHEQVYGYATEAKARMVNLRTAHRVPTTAGNISASSAPPGAAKPTHRRTVVLASGERCDVPVVRREGLLLNAEISGPTIVEQADTTTVVADGWSGRVEEHGHLILRRVTP